MPVTLGQPDGQHPPGSWGHNVGAFMKHYPGWVIQGNANGLTAQRRGPNRRPRGPVLEAPTLDQLAALIEAAGPGPA